MYYNRQGEAVTASEFTSLMADNRVALTEVADYRVSTVFLGIDHNYGDGAPLIFETMVFNGEDMADQFMDRYSTEEAARRGHENVVGMVRALEGAEAAEAPAEKVSQTITAGAAIRHLLRAQMDTMGIEWTEHKGLIESAFSVTGTRTQLTKLNEWIEGVGN